MVSRQEEFLGNRGGGGGNEEYFAQCSPPSFESQKVTLQRQERFQIYGICENANYNF